MKKDITRRTALKWTSAAGGMAVVGSQLQSAAAVVLQTKLHYGDWSKTHDRVWLGGAYWANPMEDWRVVNGAAECQSLGGNRSVHSIVHQLTNPAGQFEMSVHVQQVESKGGDSGAGFRIGVRSELDEYRSNCFAAKGLVAGLVGNQLQLGSERAKVTDGSKLINAGVVLHLTSQPDGEQQQLTLEARSPETAAVLGKVTAKVAHESLLGNVTIVSGYVGEGVTGTKAKKNTKSSQAGGRHRFTSWTIQGDAFTVRPERKFGPILWSMYTLSNSRSAEGFVLKISALTGPLGTEDSPVVELLLEQAGGSWKSYGQARLDPDAWVATFRIANWNEKQATQYKLVYREKHRDGTETPNEWSGEIKANPVDRALRMAAMTCQNDYAFPYEPVANNVAKLDPDLVYFSGDQLYENHGGFGIIREPADAAILNYLRKYYQFGWAFREVMRDRPTLCLPDDHDVFQGNIWGEGGAKMKGLDEGASSKGGYREPAKMVNVVHKTNVAHHPDAFDPTPCEQDISVYFGDMVYGGVGFAIIADRQWKSGPERVETGSGRADHVKDKDFDCIALDKPGLVLLGERQEAFLTQWAQDWRGHTLKAVLSQTVFSGLATHHGGYDGYLKADLDSGSWPQTPRNRAIAILRPSMALHINGDQHLTTLSQYGVDRQRDSNWSFCTPAIAAGYPRWWRPDELGMPYENRPQHGRDNTGEYLDGFGNKTFVYAVGNPQVGKAPNRYDKAHEKASGFGFVTFDMEKRLYIVESFRFLIDATDGKKSNQFLGWPVTIAQAENRGENVIS